MVACGAFVPASSNAQEDRLLRVVIEQVDEDYQTLDDGSVLRVAAKGLENRNMLQDAEVAKLLHARAIAFWRRGNLKDAKKDVDDLCILKPRDADARCLRTFILCGLGKHDEALTEARRVTEMSPNSGKSHCTLAFVMMSKGEVVNAARALDTATKMEPGYAEAYFMAAELFSNIDPVECLKAADRFLQLSPFPGQRAEMAFYRKGFSLSLLNRPREALVCFQAARTLDPKNVQTNSELSLVYLDLGKFHLSAHYAEQCVRLAPKLPVGYVRAAQAYGRVGRLQEARTMVEKLVELSSDDDSFLCSLGDVHRTIGDYSKSLAYYDKAIAKEPGHFLATVGKALLLASCPEAKVRDGMRAAALATQALERKETRTWQRWRPLLALADAHAENGDFAKASQTAKDAFEAAGPEFGGREAILQRISLFEKRQPYRIDPPK